MPDRPDVEFVADDGEPDSGDEVLEVRRGRPSRWTWLALLAAVGVVVGLIAADRGGSHSTAAPSPSSSVVRVTQTVGPPTPSAAPAPAPLVGRKLPLAGRGPALDLVTTQDSTWVLQARRITLVDEFQSIVASVSWPGAPAGASARLQVDTIANELWVIVSGTARSRVYKYSAFALVAMSTTTLPDVLGAAAFNGHLYVTSQGRLLDIPPLAVPRIVGLTRDSLGPVVADLARSLIVVLDTSGPTHVWRYRPGHKLMPTPLTLPIGKVSIGVTSHGDWIGGFATDGPLLWHMTNTADQASGVSALNRQLAPGAVIVAAGTSVFWVRAGTASAGDLWCVAARTGRIEQHWVLDGPVASTAGVAVIGTDSGVVRLDLTGCQG